MRHHQDFEKDCVPEAVHRAKLALKPAKDLLELTRLDGARLIRVPHFEELVRVDVLRDGVLEDRHVTDGQLGAYLEPPRLKLLGGHLRREAVPLSTSRFTGAGFTCTCKRTFGASGSASYMVSKPAAAFALK